MYGRGWLLGLDGMRRKVPGAGPAMWWIEGESASPAFLFTGLQGTGEACPYSPVSCSELGWAPAEKERILVWERL